MLREGSAHRDPALGRYFFFKKALREGGKLRRTRRYALQLCDEFLPAAFLEIFGDPVQNERGWQTSQLEDIADKITDGEHINPKFVREGYTIVMAEQVEHVGVNLRKCKMVSSSDFQRFVRKCNPKEDDILIVSRGATIGRTCVVNTTTAFCLMGSVILIKPKQSQTDARFLAAQLKSRSFLAALRSTSGTSAQQAT